MKYFTLIIIFTFSLAIANDESIKAIVNANKVRIREKPSINSNILSVVNKGDVIFILDRSDRAEIIDAMDEYWFKVKFENISGWIYGYYITSFSGYKNKTIKIVTNYCLYDLKFDGCSIIDKPCELQIICPSIWSLHSSVINDYRGSKIGEIHFVHLLENNQTSDELIDNLCKNTKCISKTNLATVYPTKRIITGTVYEGSAPEWIGKWYPVEYYITYEKKTIIRLTFYLNDLKDLEMLKLFDEISKSIKLQ
jgi:hypothetical protein